MWDRKVHREDHRLALRGLSRNDKRYDLEVKEQGHIFLQSVLLIVTQIFLSIQDRGAHIWHNNCMWRVDYNKGFRSPIRVLGQGHKYLNSVFQLATRNFLLFYDSG